jgi:hypothetical protein
MSTENFGLVGWDQVEFNHKGGGDNRKRDEFIRLQSGSNIVRLVTKPYQYVIHKWKENESDKGYGDKVMCSMFHGSCPLCEKGDRPKQRWYVGVIDRKTQSYKILDMSPLIFQKVQKLNRKEGWGDPGTYDIDIIVDKNAGATGYYTVMPEAKTPLSDKDVEIKTGEVDHDSLKKRCKPPEYNEVIRQMGVIRQRKNGKATTVEAAQAAPAPAPAADTGTGSDGEAYDFPPANAQAAN